VLNPGGLAQIMVTAGSVAIRRQDVPDCDERHLGSGEFRSGEVEKVREPLYCGHIAGNGGSGASDAVPADLSYHKGAARLHPTNLSKEAGDRHMDNKPAQNIQDTFLNTVRKDKTPITIYLVSGVKLTGKIRSFDKYSVLLENNSQEQLIFKHAISTVVSNRSVMHSEHRPALTGMGPAAVPAPAPPAANAEQR
jgi:host factor-I protein